MPKDSGVKEVIKAEELALKQREISVSEFFTKNRHLLGFDSPAKAILMAIKEAVDNSLDACQEMSVLPEIIVEIKQLSENRFKISVEDNGPGIVKEQIPRVFAKLLYGSKFHTLKQSLTADEPIIIQRNGRIEILPIGEFIDKYISEEEGVKNVEGISAPAFDFKDYKYKFRNVSHIIKHKRQNEVIRIKTDNNREIKVTGCHSLFELKDNKLVEVEARNLRVGSYIVAPKKLPNTENINSINILNYLSYEDIKNNWFYVYGIKKLVLKLKESAEIIHKKIDKSRKFYRIKQNDTTLDILDDSMKQYITKGFLPLKLVYQLGLIKEVPEGYVITYKHGNISKTPIIIQLNKEFLRFLGTYIAEGHPDTRQLGLTFGKHEQKIIDEVLTFAQTFGLGFNVEPRESSIRVKLFNNLFVKFIRNICGRGAHNKIIPEFVFRVNEYYRQHFIDAYCQGDGHKIKDRNQLSFSTVSKKLAISLRYLFLMQGISVGHYESYQKGLGKLPSHSYLIYLNGNEINKSYIYQTSNPTKERQIYYNSNKIINSCLVEKEVTDILLKSDFLLIKIKDIEIINEGYEYVYDLSVPECENFVGGIGGIACHNSRGQQGIGISAAVLYSQLTTGKPAVITSKTAPKQKAHHYWLHINTVKNEPEIVKEESLEWNKDHGTKVEIELEGKYQKGKQSVDEYLKETAIVNPHAKIIYVNALNEKVEYPRVTNELPVEAVEIKPHPYGIELGILIKMLKSTESRTLSSFLQNDFSRISSATAKEICDKANLDGKLKPEELDLAKSESLYKSMQNTKIIAPPTNCISPIGEELLLKGLKKEINADFYTAVSRSPVVYKGRPFAIEIGVAYGGDLDKEAQARLMRFANRVPLLYQQGACAITEGVQDTNWRPYGLQQSSGSMPYGPLVLVIHMASVWVPFTSESKDAIAHYEDIIKEIKLGLQECGRRLGIFIRKNVKAKEQQEKIDLFTKYIPELANSLSRLTGEKPNLLIEELNKILQKNMKDLLSNIENSEIKEEIRQDMKQNIMEQEENRKAKKEKPKKKEVQSKLK